MAEPDAGSAQSRMTHLVGSPPSIDALQNDQSLPHASDIRLTENMEYRRGAMMSDALPGTKPTIMCTGRVG